MTSTIADQTAQDLAIYLAARDVMADVPVNATLDDHQRRMRQVVDNFTPDCPHDLTGDGVHNSALTSQPYLRNGRTYVWSRCTCGLAEGDEYPA